MSGDPGRPESRLAVMAAEPQYSKVNVLRLQSLVELLGDRMGLGEVRAVLDELAPDQPAALNAGGAGWMAREQEERLVTQLCDRFDAWRLLVDVGRDAISSHLTQVLPVLPGVQRLSDVLEYLPALVAAYQPDVSARVSRTGRNLYEASFPGQLNRLEVLFYGGFIQGLLQFLSARDGEVRMEACPLTKEQWPAIAEDRLDGVAWGATELVFRVSAENLGHGLGQQKRAAARLGWNTSAKEAFVKQVIARSSRLLRDKRELTTAVEYLNMANDELDRQLKANERELTMAAAIQRSFVPPMIPDWEGIQFWTHYSPLREVSGDLYDYFQLSEDRLALLVADVSGHGVPAALISSIAKISFQTHRSELPSNIFAGVNLDLLNFVKMEGYVAATYMMINRRHEVTYSVASMPGPYLFRARSGEVTRLPGRGTMLGMFPNAPDYLSNQTVRLEPGDRLFVFTDGLVEAANTRGDYFGEDNLVRAIHQTAGMNVRESCEHVIDRYRHFILGAGAHDDLTLVVFMVSEHRERFEELAAEAEAIMRKGDPAAACARMEKAVAIFPRHPGALYRYSKYLSRAGRYEEALDYLKELLRLKPGFPNAHTIEGYCNYRLGRYERAAADLKRALALRSENPSALYHLVKVYQKQGRHDEARRTLLELKYLSPEDPRVRSLKLQELGGESE